MSGEKIIKKIITVMEWITRINQSIGRVVSWLTLVMIAVVCMVVFLRYGFSVGWVWLQESYIWMHGLVFMLSMSATLAQDGHVRVDIFYRDGAPHRRAWVNIGGVVFFLWPLVVTLLSLSWPYAIDSWMRLEFSREAGGLPGLFLLKTIIPVTCILLFLQGLAMISAAVLSLKNDAQTPAVPPTGAF